MLNVGDGSKCKGVGAMYRNAFSNQPPPIVHLKGIPTMYFLNNVDIHPSTAFLFQLTQHPYQARKGQKGQHARGGGDVQKCIQ